VELGREVMTMQDSPRQPIPISQRRIDLLFVAFFLLITSAGKWCDDAISLVHG
jgi:hypothetical protein